MDEDLAAEFLASHGFETHKHLLEIAEEWAPRVPEALHLRLCTLAKQHYESSEEIKSIMCEMVYQTQTMVCDARQALRDACTAHVEVAELGREVRELRARLRRLADAQPNVKRLRSGRAV
jgi:hypothetical protein